jgi:hypothetical protein
MTYLAADQPKTTESFPPADWSNEDVARPLRTDEARTGLALALHLFDLGRSREGRLGLAAELGRQRAMREAWFRSLLLEIKHRSVPSS